MKSASYCWLLMLLLPLINSCIKAARLQSGPQRQRFNDDVKRSSGQNAITTRPHASEIREEEEEQTDTRQCPSRCVCQYAHFMDLPISRWINHMHAARHPDDNEHDEDPINDNETAYEGDDSFVSNPFIKQATCILQEDSDIHELINSLPHDLQALLLLYTGIGHNKTVATSILKPLNQMNTLEMRGPPDLSLRLVFDEPLSFLQHVNFESLMLLGSDTFKRPKATVHPREKFSYKPRIEMDFYSTEGHAEVHAHNADQYESLRLQHNDHDEIEILPYDIYLQEVKKARMPTFYGWEHLEVLRIHSCQLRELHWEMFDGLDALQHLSLERNEIELITALALFGANNIRTLSLANNAIQDLHYRALGGLLNLETLNLRNNKLSKLSEMTFPPFPKLRHADFRQNPIRYIFPATFGVMNATRTLLFQTQETALELWSNEPFQSLTELKEMSLENVSIATLDHGVFQGLALLEALKMRGAIRNVEFDAFADQTELRTVDLSHCHIEEISMDAFMGCRKLEIVNLAHNQLSYVPPGFFDDQKNLQEVYLEGNNLQTLPTRFFYPPKLKLARLTDNPWKCTCAMYNWRAKVTNQVRGIRMERCINDYTTGKQLSCYKFDNYQFDHRYAPRCDNYNGRSVFYVLRKNLQCGHGRTVSAVGRHRMRQPNAAVLRLQKLRQIEERREHHKEKASHKKQIFREDAVAAAAAVIIRSKNVAKHTIWPKSGRIRVSHTVTNNIPQEAGNRTSAHSYFAKISNSTEEISNDI